VLQLGDYMAAMPQDFYSKQWYNRWQDGLYRLTATVPIPTSTTQARAAELLRCKPPGARACSQRSRRQPKKWHAVASSSRVAAGQAGASS
jgi:hypothetical protein